MWRTPALIFALAVAAAPIASAQTVNQREERQEQRIQQGERNGALTPNEAMRLQRSHARIERQEARMRWRNGGTLSRAQRARLQRKLDRQRRMIRRLKHNGRRSHVRVCRIHHHVRHCYWR